jgi:hypothetical protein
MNFKIISLIVFISIYNLGQTHENYEYKRDNLIKCTLHYSTYKTGFIGCNK